MPEQPPLFDKEKTSHARRGKEAEGYLNRTHEIYLRRGQACINKNAERWNYCNANKYAWGEKKAPMIYAKTADGKHFLEKVKSDIDYSGSARGRHIAFDAKQTDEKRFDLNLLERHQEQSLRMVHLSGAIAGVMLYLKSLLRIFFIPYPVLQEAYLQRDFKRGPKSISLEDLEAKAIEIPLKYPFFDWLDVLVPSAGMRDKG